METTVNCCLDQNLNLEDNLLNSKMQSDISKILYIPNHENFDGFAEISKLSYLVFFFFFFFFFV